MSEELVRPRYFKEANCQFLLPGDISMNGMPPGFVLIIVGMGLGYWWLIPLGFALSLYLARKVGKDELFLKSLFQHLLTYKGMRYIGAAPTEPQTKVSVITRNGETLAISDWLQRRIERKHDGGR